MTKILIERSWIGINRGRFSHLEHTTHSLVRDYLLAFCLVFLVLEVRHNSYWRISLGIYGVSLMEGLQLGYDYAFFMICK
jgi:hypothetical protein